MTEQNRNFIVSQRDSLIALFTEWQGEVLQAALGKDKSDEREYLIDFVRFLKERIQRIRNFDDKSNIKKETFV